MTTLFEGKEVDGITVKVKATELGADVHHHGAEVYVLVRAEVTDIQHPVDKDGLMVRRQIATPDQAWMIPQLG